MRFQADLDLRPAGTGGHSDFSTCSARCPATSVLLVRAMCRRQGDDEPRWHHQLAFRDRLRASDTLVQDYARLKVRAAARYNNDRERYTRAKNDFVRSVVDDQ